MFVSCTQSREVKSALLLKKYLLIVKLQNFHYFFELRRAGAGDCTKPEETTCHVCAADENALITRIMSKKLHDGLKEFAVTVPLSRNKDYSRKSGNIPAQVPTDSRRIIRLRIIRLRLIRNLPCSF